MLGRLCLERALDSELTILLFFARYFVARYFCSIADVHSPRSRRRSAPFATHAPRPQDGRRTTAERWRRPFLTITVRLRLRARTSHRPPCCLQPGAWGASRARAQSVTIPDDRRGPPRGEVEGPGRRARRQGSRGRVKFVEFVYDPCYVPANVVRAYVSLEPRFPKSNSE